MNARFLWLALLCAFSINSIAADIPLLEFCLKPAPDEDSLRKLHEKECPGVIALAAQQGQNAVSAAREQDEAAAQKAMLENLQSALPKLNGNGGESKAPSIDDLKHVAEFAEAKSLESAGRKVYQEIHNKYGSSGRIIRVISTSDLDALRRSTLTPMMAWREIEDLRVIVSTATQDCQRKTFTGSPGAGPNVILFSGGVSDGGLLKLNSIFDVALKISQAFQTNLGDTVAGGLEEKVSRIVVQGFLAAHAVQSSSQTKFFVGVPVVTDENALAEHLQKLKKETDILIGLISKSDEKSTCSTNGKSAIEVVTTRLQRLNSAPEASAPSFLLTAMRIEEITQQVAKKTDKQGASQSLLVIERVLSGSTLVATKSAFRSQRYTRLVTASVAYRIEEYGGELLSAGTVFLPDAEGKMAMIDKFDKKFDRQEP
jgi:hypothetical protein